MPQWILITQWVSWLVLALLIGLSVWSVSIMIDRHRFFKSLAARRDGTDAKSLLKGPGLQKQELKRWADSNATLTGGVLKSALEVESNQAEAIDRAVRSYLTEQRGSLEKGLTVLATLGSNAPFIGLFGTVLGIIQAFGQLANQKQGSSAVMSGISEALIATAVGLFVAIPAVVAYNVFAKKARDVLGECEALRDLYISRVGNGS